MKWRMLLLWATAFIIIAWTGWLVVQNERLLAAGKPVLIELAPVDPRSLIQGDYMRLRYNLAIEDSSDWPTGGTLVATLDGRGVVQATRLYDGQQTLGSNEQLLRYHTRDMAILIGAESYLFQEGSASIYETARYGELRAASDGTSLLVGLRDDQLRPLGKPAP